MMLRRRHQKHLSNTMLMLLLGAASFGLILFTRELPSMRRYLRIRRM